MDKETLVLKKDELDEVDWAHHSLELGVALPRPNVPWLELDYQELCILRDLLSKQVLVKGPCEDISRVGPVEKHHAGLRSLLDWVESAIRWYRKGGGSTEVKA